MFYIPIFKMENLRITTLCGCITDIRGNNTPIFHLRVRDTQKNPLPTNVEFYEEFSLPDYLFSLLLHKVLIKILSLSQKDKEF